MRLIDAEAINPNIYEISPKKFGIFQEVAKKLPTMQAISVDKIKRVGEEIAKLKHEQEDAEGHYIWWNNAVENCLHEIDKLIAESEDK